MPKLHLTGRQRFELSSLVKAEYVTKALGDEGFAKYAVEKLGFTVNRDHVFHTREDFEIPSTRASKKTAGGSTVIQRLETLESLVAHMQSKLKDLLK